MEESSEISPDTYVSIQRMIDQSNKRMEDYRNSPEGIRDREYSDRMADARQQRRVLISDIVSRGGCLEENIVVEDILDHERQIMFEHHFPNSIQRSTSMHWTMTALRIFHTRLPGIGKLHCDSSQRHGDSRFRMERDATPLPGCHLTSIE
jgi:hypothetical protein